MGENVDIAMRALDVFMRRSFDEARRLCSAEVELTTLYDESGEHEFTGREGLRLWFERLDELWAFTEIQGVEVEERDGGGWVLMRVAARVRGRGSPHEFEPRVAVAVKVADGEISKFGLFSNEADALAMIAAG